MTELTKADTFQQRMFERIRESMGELLSEDDLKELLERTIEKSFFEERIVPSSSHYYDRDKKKPSLFQELVTEQVQPMMEKAITAWLQDNSEQVTTTIDAVLKDGLLGALSKAIEYKMQTPILSLRQEISNKLLS
jgi:hypothetical protein